MDNLLLSKQFNFNLDYKIIKKVSTNTIQQIKVFFNQHYITSSKDHYKLFYSIDLFSFYIQNSVIIEFYPKNKSKVIGYIIGKKCNLAINKDDTHRTLQSIEVNFLCLIPQLRNIGISNYMKQILAKECSTSFNINKAHFTSSHNINMPFFCEKKFYHRVFNIKVLKDINWFLDYTDDDELKYKQFFNTFNITNEFKEQFYINYYSNLEYDEKSLELINTLYPLYISYCEKQFEIYEKIDINTFKSSFFNKAFHHFVIKKKSDSNIYAYVSLFQLDTLYTLKDIKCKSGYYYYMFFNDNISKSNALEFVHEYIFNNGLFDLVNFSDIFDFDMSLIKTVSGSSQLKYYSLNNNISTIVPSRNGLVTI